MPRIRVLHNYGSAATPARIVPGEYELDDPRLFEQGRYLLENGHAEIVDEHEPEITGEDMKLVEAGDENAPIPAPVKPASRKRSK